MDKSRATSLQSYASSCTSDQNQTVPLFIQQFFLSHVYKQQLELFFPLFIISLHDKMRRRKNNMSKNIISEMWLTAVDYDAR